MLPHGVAVAECVSDSVGDSDPEMEVVTEEHSEGLGLCDSDGVLDKEVMTSDAAALSLVVTDGDGDSVALWLLELWSDAEWHAVLEAQRDALGDPVADRVALLLCETLRVRVSEVLALRDVVADCDCVMEGVVVGDALGVSEPHDEGDVDGDRDEDSVAEALRDVELQPLALRETEDDGVVDAV